LLTSEALFWPKMHQMSFGGQASPGIIPLSRGLRRDWNKEREGKGEKKA